MSDRIGLPVRMQGSAVDRLADGWRLWMHTADHIYGTYLLLKDDGSAVRVTVRDDGEEEWQVKTTD